MKIAITSTGNGQESLLDNRFGRCSFFVIYDTISHSTEYIPNPYNENIEGAGLASVRLIASRDVKKVVSGEFGTKVKSIFDSHKIQLVVLNDPKKRISEIIELLKHKK
jgi:predicted Fe-Mo cluster-binding NifX family protein